MITKLVKNMLNNSNRYPNSSNGERRSKDILRGSRCRPGNSGDSLNSHGYNSNRFRNGENHKDPRSKIGCKFNLLSSLPGRLREVQIMVWAGRRNGLAIVAFD